jgi:hypothetical protein
MMGVFLVPGIIGALAGIFKVSSPRTLSSCLVP